HVDVLGRLHDRSPPLAADPVAAEIQRDPVEPRRELRLAAEPRQGAKRTEKRLLTHVSRILFATDRAVREGVDGTLPSQHQFVEALRVAANRSSDELFVRPRHAGARKALSLSADKTAEAARQSGDLTV